MPLIKSRNFIFTVAAILTVFVPPCATAGCGDSKATCYTFNGKNITNKQPCKITECANVYGGLQRWKLKNGKSISIDISDKKTIVNGKPGFFKKKDDMSCYGVNSKVDELFCIKEN